MTSFPMLSNLSNITTENTTIGPREHEPGDATWILTSAFIIFTMQSGFGLLESGMVSRKNETSIMVKNAVDVIFGGLAYWLFGFGFSFGDSKYSNAFCGIGYFFADSLGDDENLGWIHAKFFFQLSFATTATTIVSGAMAERTNLKAYTAFSFMSVLTYCFPAHWVWDKKTGWLHKLGFVDIAGASPVHVVGGISGLLATLMLKPRYRKFDNKGRPRQTEISSPTNILLGTFMLWWGWLGFNCGSTFGVSGGRWKLASRSAVTTLNSSAGGAAFAMIFSYITENNVLTIPIFVTGIISGLVSITGICAVCRPGEAFIIGIIGSFLACAGCRLLEKLRIDDPVCCVPTHLFAGSWSVICVALFAEKDNLEEFTKQPGLFKGGEWKFLGVQLLGLVTIAAWAGLVGFAELYLIDKVIGLRVSLMDEIIGADQCEHGIADAANLQKLSRANVYSAAGVKVRLAKTRRRTFAVKQPRHGGTLSFTNRRTLRRQSEEDIKIRRRKIGTSKKPDSSLLHRSVFFQNSTTLEEPEAVVDFGVDGANIHLPNGELLVDKVDVVDIRDIRISIQDHEDGQRARSGSKNKINEILNSTNNFLASSVDLNEPGDVDKPDQWTVLCRVNGGFRYVVERAGDSLEQEECDVSAVTDSEDNHNDTMLDTKL